MLRGLLPFLILLFLLSSCRFSKSFDVRGRVVGFGDDNRTLIVEHEEVPGFMPAMTMPFRTTEAGAVDRVEKGAAVSFRLHVSPDSSWITDLQLLPDSAVARHPAAGDDSLRTVSTTGPILEPGDAAPDFALLDQEADTVQLSDFEGRPVVLTFIYTRCPLPEYCPLMSQRFQTLQSKLQDAYGQQVQLLSVSFDPEYDTPEVLAAYGDRYDADPSIWTFATGSTQEIQRLAGRFGVHYQEDGGEYLHNLATALIGPEGRVRQIWRGNRWSADEVLAEVRSLAAVEPDRG